MHPNLIEWSLYSSDMLRNIYPLNATLTVSLQSNFGVCEATSFLDAVVGVAAASKQCQTRSWRDVGATRAGFGDGFRTDTFCSMSNERQVREIQVQKTHDEINSLKVRVSIEVDPGQGFDWCSIANSGETIAGVFECGALVSAGFGVSSWFCDLAIGN